MNMDDTKNIDRSNLRLSIITATFNSSKSLPFLISSLRKQTDKLFEWVIIDNESTDGTLDLIECNRDIISKYITEPDFGVYDAINKGISLSSGEYYLVVGSDDVLESNAIEQFKKEAVESDADIVTAPVMMNGEKLQWRHGPYWLYGYSVYISGHAVGTIFRKCLHDIYGLYSNKYPIAADQLFVAKSCKGGATRHYADFIAGTFGDGGLSSCDTAGLLTEIFRVKLETEKKLPQLILFFIRLIKNYRRL